MSSNKKSLGSILLLLFIFLAMAGGSWLYFDKNKLSDGDTSTQSGDMSSADSDGDDHGHSHSDDGNTAQSTGMAGEKGTIQALPVNPVLGRRGVGDPNAPIKIQEFYSLTCNHCANFHNDVYPDLKEKYIDTGKVYFVFEEFPLNGPALYGSMIARCLPAERYSSFVGLLLKNQDVWAFGGDFKGSLKQNAMLAGMSADEFETCFNNKDLQASIGQNIKAASELWEIRSTPSFIFNDGEMLLRGGHAIESFDSVIEQLMNGDAEETSTETAPVEPVSHYKVKETSMGIIGGLASNLH